MKKKAVLSNRILLPFDPALYARLKKKLTYKIPSRIFNEPPTTKLTIKRMGDKLISLPSGRQDLIPSDHVIIDKRTCPEAEFPEFNFTLRPNQKDIYDQVDGNCLINANTSWGKTFTAIAIAKKLGLKTLVITHTTILRKQWEDEVRKTLSIEPGVIGSGYFHYDSPITICNIQTFRKHAEKLRSEFGTILVDEVHHTPSSTFESTLNILKAKYKIGLSATLKRKDNLHVILQDYFGFKVLIPPEENQLKPEVLIIKSPIVFNSDMTIPWARKVNDLIRDEDYVELITSLAEEHANLGHKVLVVSDRTEFIDKCQDIHSDISIKVTGETPEKEREERHMLVESGLRKIIYGAISIYKEGVSLNYLSCLILAAPMNNEPMLQQLIGRITRKQEGKLQPLVIDIILSGTTAKRQGQARASYYAYRGLDIKMIDQT
jgi:superfamily II DNA or RNA helicase